MYKINNNIPGWNGRQILNILAELSHLVPENGRILELGALFGRSTYALGHNKKPSVELHVVEIWPTILLSNHTEVNYHDSHCGEDELRLLESKIKQNPGRLEGQDFYELWKYWTQGIPNLHSVRGFTTAPNDHYPDFDFIFHDAGHSYDDVYNDLDHWLPKLKPDGIIVIDDYDRGSFSGLCDAVDKFVEENNLQTQMVTGRNILLKRKE